MKNSGIEWSGQIPENWKIRRLGTIGKFYSSGIDKKISDEEIPVKIVNYVDVYNNKKHELYNADYMEVTTTEDKIKQHCLKQGDLIFTPSSETIEDIGISALVMEDLENTAYSYHVLRFIFTEYIDEKYKKYLCNNYLTRNYFSKCATGSIRKTLSRLDMKNAYVILPPIDMQHKIAVFLDGKIEEIDNIISKTKESIEEYKRYKQAVITETITQGLNKSVELINTNNVHISKIPVHWQMKKVKYIFKIKKDIAGKEGYAVLSITQKGIKVKDISKNEGQLAQDYSKYQLVDIGDFAMNHMDLLTGWVDISKYNGVTSPDYRVFRFINSEAYNANYYLYLMQMCYMNRIFYGLGQGVSNLGRWRLQSDKFLNFTIPEPPLNEQNEIVKYLDEKCIEIDNLIAKKEALVADLEEYRKSLIYEYVTGKKEVPEEKVVPFPVVVNCKNKRFAQAVLLTKILDEFGDYYSGRVKVAKTLYVLENHIGFDFEADPLRKVAGPLDKQYYEAEAIVRHNKWFNVSEQKDSVKYFVGTEKDKYLPYYDKYFREYNVEIQRIIDIFKNLNMDKAELLATAYASWNDFIIKGESFDKDDIVEDIFAWDDSKKRFTKEAWFGALTELEAKGLSPLGHGKITILDKE